MVVAAGGSGGGGGSRATTGAGSPGLGSGYRAVFFLGGIFAIMGQQQGLVPRVLVVTWVLLPLRWLLWMTSADCLIRASRPFLCPDVVLI